MTCHDLHASCGPEPCGYCGAAPCVGDGCPSNWLCVSCGVNPAGSSHPECAGCRAITERLIRNDHARDHDPADDESWTEDHP